LPLKSECERARGRESQRERERERERETERDPKLAKDLLAQVRHPFERLRKT